MEGRSTHASLPAGSGLLQGRALGLHVSIWPGWPANSLPSSGLVSHSLKSLAKIVCLYLVRLVPADYDRWSGQELCDACSCAIFNGLFEALAAAGHKVSSIDEAILDCADNLWQGLMDTGALSRKTQLYLSTCVPGDCAYSNSTAAVADVDVEYQKSKCPMAVEAFSSSPPLRASVKAACSKFCNCIAANQSAFSTIVLAVDRVPVPLFGTAHNWKYQQVWHYSHTSSLCDTSTIAVAAAAMHLNCPSDSLMGVGVCQSAWMTPISYNIPACNRPGARILLLI